MKLKIEFSGGLELLFDSKKEHGVEVPAPDGRAYTVGQLLVWTRDTLCRERPELFMKGESVRPGILVLVNDCDWELRWARLGPACVDMAPALAPSPAAGQALLADPHLLRRPPLLQRDAQHGAARRRPRCVHLHTTRRLREDHQASAGGPAAAVRRG
jgi:ubiquitin related modifier 1